MKDIAADALRLGLTSPQQIYDHLCAEYANHVRQQQEMRRIARKAAKKVLRLAFK